MGRIYVIEGVDGTGKTTLANKLAEKTKAHILHANYRDGLDVGAYHKTMMTAALTLNEFGDSVILDRWSPSEAVYAKIFRGGETYDTDKMMMDAAAQADITWIYCYNENAVKNHELNKSSREEMYEDIEKVNEEYEIFISLSKLPWLRYNFNHVDVNDFVNWLVETNERIEQ